MKIKVKKQEQYFIGRGEQVKTVKLIEKITEPDAINFAGNFPLYKVELPNGKIEVFSHKFFEVKEKNTKY